MNKRSVLSILLSAISVVVLARGATSQAPLSAAAYATTAHPNVNYGRAAVLPVQSGVTTYLKFDFSRLPVKGCIGRATLRLHVNAVTSSGMLNVYEVNSAWSENTITQGNAPVLGGLVNRSQPISVTATNLNSAIEVDLTEVAQRWLSGKSPNNGIALRLSDRGSSDGSFSFVGRVPGDAHAAHIDADPVNCADTILVLTTNTVKCVASDENCTFDDMGAEDHWFDTAKDVCASSACPTAAGKCSLATQPTLNHHVNASDNYCKGQDQNKPKGCYAFANGVVQCQCQ